MSRNGFRTVVAILCLLAVFASGCGKDEAPAADQHAQQGHRPGGGGGPGSDRNGGAARQQAIPVAVEAAVSGTINSYYKATATLEAEKTAQVLARASGIVKRLEAEEGDMVSAGGAMLRIDNDEYRFRLEQAEATTANLRSRFERLEQMMAEELGTQEEYQAARSDLANAEAEEGMARLNLGYTTVIAPFSGQVTERLVDLGQTVNSGDPLFVVSDFNPLLAKVHVPSREFNKLRRDQKVDLVMDSNGTRLSGRIMLISPVIDPASGTIKLTVEVPEYPVGTRPGDFAQVQIVTERREDAILVPRGAVITDKGETVVFTLAVGEDGPTAERRIVETGFTDDQSAQIVSGLATGDRVVVKGQRSLKHGVPVKILEGPDTAAGGSD